MLPTRALPLLCLLAAAGCSSQPLVLVAVGNMPQGTTSLQAMIVLDGQDAIERPAFDLSGLTIGSDTLYRFGLRLPGGSSGSLALGVSALDARGCLLGTGDVTGLDPLGQAGKDVSVTLSPLSVAGVKACVQRLPFVQAVSPAPDDESMGGAQQGSVRGWGFLAGATLRAVPMPAGADPAVCDGATCPADAGTPLPGVSRSSPAALTFTLPPVQSPSGRDTLCVVAQNPDGARSCQSADVYRYTFRRAVIPLSGALVEPMATVHPDHVDIGDLDGDGLPDLAMSATALPQGQPARAVVVLLWNQGGGRFQGSPTVLPAGSAAASLVIADMDRDGRKDLIYSDGTAGKVRVLLNRGQRTFSGPDEQAVNVPSQADAMTKPDSLAVADLDEDGRPDIAVVNAPVDPMTPVAQDRVTLLLSRGAQPALLVNAGNVVAGTSLGFLRARDVDLDGHVDLLVTGLRLTLVNGMFSATGGVSVLRNGSGNGGVIGTFGDITVADPSQPVYPVTGSSAPLAMADFDGDGRPDIAVSGQVVRADKTESDVVTVLRNTLDNRFSTVAVDHPAGTHHPFSVEAIDLPGAPASLAVTNFVPGQPGRVTLLVNPQGKGVFSGQDLPDFPDGLDSGSLAVGDLDGDGLLDMVVASLGVINDVDRTQSKAGSVTIYLNTSPR